MGVCREGMLNGDHIAVISGSIFPCILRSEGDCFIIICECYLHGLDLNGIMEDGDVESQDLILQ